VADGPRTHHDHDQALAVATELHAAGDSGRALELLPDLVAARPDDLVVRLLLARCLTTAGSPAVALAAAEAAVACDPTSWEAQALLSRAALVTDPDAAAIAAERAVMLAPGEPDAIRAQVAVRTAQAGPESEGTTRRATGLAALGRRPAPTLTDRPELGDLEPRLTPRLPAALDPLLASPPPPAGVAAVEPVARAEADDAPPAVATPPSPAKGPAPAPAGPDGATPPSRAKGPLPPAGAPSTPAAAPPSLAKSPPPAAWPTLPESPPVAWPSTPADPPTPADETRARRDAPLPVSLGGTGLGGTQPTDDDAPQVGGGRLTIRVLGLATWLFLGFRLGLQGIGGPAGTGLFLLTVAGAVYGARQLRSV
jgi:hypothetical protein